MRVLWTLLAIYAVHATSSLSSPLSNAERRREPPKLGTPLSPDGLPHPPLSILLGMPGSTPSAAAHCRWVWESHAPLFSLARFATGGSFLLLPANAPPANPFSYDINDKGNRCQKTHRTRLALHLRSFALVFTPPSLVRPHSPALPHYNGSALLAQVIHLPAASLWA